MFDFLVVETRLTLGDTISGIAVLAISIMLDAINFRYPIPKSLVSGHLAPELLLDTRNV